MAYWFFTPYTIPDHELLDILHPEKHEVALHVATKPYTEWKKLENATGRKVSYYTVHGTARLLARLMWKRKLWEARASIPIGFPLKSFYDFPTIGLDRLCYEKTTPEVVEMAKESILNGEILHIHPEWLFQRGKLNHRGPYYNVLKTLLKVDSELDALSIRKRFFIKIAKYNEENEYLKDRVPSKRFLEKITERGADLFTFVERKWCCQIANPSSAWAKSDDNIALLEITTYADWLSTVGKKTRNMIRKAERSGVKIEVAEPSEKLADGIWKIYNETPIRQKRAFSHYGVSYEKVKNNVFSARESIFIGAYLDRKLVGFVQLLQGNQIAVMAQILSLQKFWDKALNNALVAKAVEVCASRQMPWLMYGRMGNHPSLDTFKMNNGFSKYTVNRYYLPLTKKGQLAIKLGLQRETKDTLPDVLKDPLFPVFNWLSRAKIRIR